VFVLIIFISCAGVLAAQERSPEHTSEFFVKTVPISKVYMHRLGYRIVYQKSNHQMAAFYVPNSWFHATDDGKAPQAELITERTETVPYFSIFWQNGEFDHIRLYLHRNKDHISYGDLADPEAINDRFDVETLNLDF